MTTPNPNPQLPAYIRTYVPLLVVLIGRELSKHGFSIDSELLNVVVGIVLAAAYYAAVRFAESHKAQFGWLLGMAKQPAYAPGPPPAPADDETVVADTVPDGAAPPTEGD